MQALIQRVHVLDDAALDARGHTAVDLELRTRDGRSSSLSLDIAPGFPGHPLTEAQHQQRFADCMAYAPWPLAADEATALREDIDALAGREHALGLWRVLFDGAGRREAGAGRSQTGR